MLSAAWVPRRVWFISESLFGEDVFGPYTVRPPTVRTGLAVSEAYDQAKASGFDDPGAFAVLSYALRDWLPMSLWSVLLADDTSREEAFNWAMHHLALGCEDREAYKRALHTVTEGQRLRNEAADTSWASAVAEYRVVYSVSFEEIMAESWLVFIWQLEYVERQRARSAVDVLRGSPYTSSSAIGKLFDTAYPTRPLTYDEQIERQKHVLADMNTMLGQYDTANYNPN